MKIAITASGPTLDVNVDPRFGRCAYFLIVDTDALDFEAVENPNIALGGGAGIQSAQLMAAKGVKFVLTGNCGPNAHETLSAVGIEVIVGCSGGARDVIQQFKAGQLTAADQPNVASHSGITDTPAPLAGQPGPGGGTGMGGRPGGGGRGMGRGQGQGQGQGGGQGRGRGMGKGQGRGQGGGGQGRGQGGGQG